jgi:hypothetical protein
MNPSGPAVRSFTAALGSPAPSTDQLVAAPWPAWAVNTPRSVPSASLPPLSTSASPGMSDNDFFCTQPVALIRSDTEVTPTFYFAFVAE